MGYNKGQPRDKAGNWSSGGGGGGGGGKPTPKKKVDQKETTEKLLAKRFELEEYANKQWDQAGAIREQAQYERRAGNEKEAKNLDAKAKKVQGEGNAQMEKVRELKREIADRRGAQPTPRAAARSKSDAQLQQIAKGAKKLGDTDLDATQRELVSRIVKSTLSMRAKAGDPSPAEARRHKQLIKSRDVINKEMDVRLYGKAAKSRDTKIAAVRAKNPKRKV